MKMSGIYAELLNVKIDNPRRLFGPLSTRRINLGLGVFMLVLDLLCLIKSPLHIFAAYCSLSALASIDKQLELHHPYDAKSNSAIHLFVLVMEG